MYIPPFHKKIKLSMDEHHFKKKMTKKKFQLSPTLPPLTCRFWMIQKSLLINISGTRAKKYVSSPFVFRLLFPFFRPKKSIINYNFPVVLNSRYKNEKNSK